MKERMQELVQLLNDSGERTQASAANVISALSQYRECSVVIFPNMS